MAAFLLLRELLDKRGARVHVRVGCPIAYDELESRRDPAALSAWLRQRTYGLAAGLAASPAHARRLSDRALTPTGQS